MISVRKRDGFTLIELLIVILIILVLSGILFKITSLVGQKGSRMRAAGQMAALKNAIEEFKAEYGSYPPSPYINGSYSTSTDYEYEDSNAQNSAFRSWLANNNDPTNGPFFGDIDRRTGTFATNDFTGKSLGYHYGLASFLYLREQDTGEQVHWYEADTDRDIAVKRGWQNLLEGVNTDDAWNGHTINIGSEQEYTNDVLRLADPWGGEYRYLCKSPYTSYKLWSYGPDGTEGTADDVGDDSWVE